MSLKHSEPPSTNQRRWRLFWFTATGLVLAIGLYCLTGPCAYWWGMRCVKQQQLIAGRNWLQRAEELGCNSGDFWLDRASLARRLSHPEEFVRALENAAGQSNRQRIDLELMLADAQRGDLTRLDKQLADVLLKGGPGDEICNAYVEGCLIKYRLDDAMAVLAVWEQDYPLDPRVNLLRGRILEHRVNVPGAQGEYLAALKKQPHFAVAAYNVARTYVTDQKPEAALPYYQICARSLGNPVPGLVGQAQCERLLRSYAAAEEHLQQAKSAVSASTDDAYRLVGEPAETAASLLSAEQGRLAAEQGQHEEAVDYFQAALLRAPRDWKLRYQLALSQRQTGDLREAEQNLKQVEDTKQALARCDRLFDVLHHDPANIEARLTIGEVFLSYVSENQGLVWLNSVLDLDPGNLAAHRLLAEYFESHTDDRSDFAELAQRHRRWLDSAASDGKASQP